MRVVSKNFPVHGEEAATIAEAALCASDQGKFWDYNDKLFESLYTGNAVYGADALKSLAGNLGLNAASFAACLDGDKYAQQVQAEASEAQQRGTTATPTFFINDTKVVGAQPFEVFKTVIESALKGK